MRCIVLAGLSLATRCHPEQAVFTASVQDITPSLLARMMYGWGENSPVKYKDLQRLVISHYDFDGVIHQGELIVRKELVKDLTCVFEQLFESKFPFNILRFKSTVFTFKELLLATNEAKPLLLKRRLSYYIKQGQLYHIRRGLYAKDKNYDKLELATKIFTPSYVSFETILRQEGIIFQYYSTIFVASYQTKEIICDGHTYSFKKIKDTILLNSAGIENKGTYFVASKERAFLDILYLNKDYHFDNLAPLNFDKIFALLPIYNNQRMAKKVNFYFKEFNENRNLL